MRQRIKGNSLHKGVAVGKESLNSSVLSKGHGECIKTQPTNPTNYHIISGVAGVGNGSVGKAT